MRGLVLKDMRVSSTEWNISFAGCGFLMAYYCGVYSCLFERAPFLLDGLKKICGASSGALMGAIVACRMSPEARKGTLGAVHPSFDLLKIVRTFLIRDLPDNAHLLTSGRLCVSLTRVSDGMNVLISEFDSKDDLIQALVCSCFYPLYCGVLPPSYHGIRYVDGALSDNMPFSNLSNTITISPFSGESDISPYGVPCYFHEIHYNNVSIHINFINAYRVVIAFFPPGPEVMAEMCLNGYKDAFVFLMENEFLELQSPLCESTLINNNFPSSRKCVKDNIKLKDGKDKTRRLKGTDSKNILPESISKVFHEAYIRESRGSFSVKLVSFIMWCILPVEMVYTILLRIIDWSPHIWSNLVCTCKTTSARIRLLWKRTFLKRT